MVRTIVAEIKVAGTTGAEVVAGRRQELQTIAIEAAERSELI